MTDFCGLELKLVRVARGRFRAPDGFYIDTRKYPFGWLIRALKDVGRPVSGMSVGGGYEAGFTMRGDSREIVPVIEALWEDERPGCGLEIKVTYD